MRYLCFVFISLLAIVSCKEKDVTTDTPTDTMGEFIYLDDNGIHHLNSRCIKLRHGKDDAGHEIYAMLPIDTAEFVITEPDYFRVCSRCVNDGQYRRLQNISSHNKYK